MSLLELVPAEAQGFGDYMIISVLGAAALILLGSVTAGTTRLLAGAAMAATIAASFYWTYARHVSVERSIAAARAEVTRVLADVKTKDAANAASQKKIDALDAQVERVKAEIAQDTAASASSADLDARIEEEKRLQNELEEKSKGFNP